MDNKEVKLVFPKACKKEKNVNKSALNTKIDYSPITDKSYDGANCNKYHLDWHI